ncbi:MAG TPA: NAD-dependent epimerase/dehydratase family protein [Thermoanaerobaculia bacterium]|jgi:nucleoside-diphosphate-sugar epimerase|nr:NAD-dependent epimerase/dehydratase family protein [Thermoanaerobaculia bacterium]
MRLFLTGGTGYIGRALARRLVESGHEVRALVRATSNAEPLKQLGIATFVGDIADRVSLREGMSGADWVLHAAADLDLTGPPERMRAANLQGSENVASLAYKLGVGRFLSVSSMAYWGGSPADGSTVGEEAPVQQPFPTLYSATKHSGELAIQEWAKKGLKVNTVFPSLVYGPPGKKEGANSILRGFLKGRFPVLVGADRRTAWIYLDDLVEGMLKVMEKALPGRGYLMTGDITTLRGLADRVCALGGVQAPRLNLPVGAARLALALSTPYYKLRGFRPPFSSDQLNSLERHWAFDDSRARTELDWHPRGLDEGLPPTVEFLKTH